MFLANCVPNYQMTIWTYFFRKGSQAITVFSGAELEVYPVIENEDDVEAVEVIL